jgi:cytochrome c peroxidase
MTRWVFPIFALSLLALLLQTRACENVNFQTAPPAVRADQALRVAIPTGLPPIQYPAGKAPTEGKFELGRRLFYDKNLSIGGSVSCASCHSPRFGFSDNRPVAEGNGGAKGTRNSPTVINAAFGKVFFLDGRGSSLDEQAMTPLLSPHEMANTREAVEKRLSDNSIYRAMFERAYGPGKITVERVSQALAVFERAILSGNSLYDKYTYLGNPRALSQSAIRGLEIFTDRGHCAVCHQLGKEFALFTDGQFHNLGVGANERGELSDLGRYNVTKDDADRGAFKTPTLRNVTQTRPYMHDGSLTSLALVVEFYNGGGRRNPHLSRLIRPLNLSPQDKIDLLAFLESLTGEPVPHIGPPEGEQ